MIRQTSTEMRRSMPVMAENSTVGIDTHMVMREKTEAKTMIRMPRVFRERP